MPYLLCYCAKIKMQDRSAMLKKCGRLLCQVFDENTYLSSGTETRILSAEQLCISRGSNFTGSYLPGQNMPYRLGYWTKTKMQDKLLCWTKCRRLLCQLFNQNCRAPAQASGSCLLSTCKSLEAPIYWQLPSKRKHAISSGIHIQKFVARQAWTAERV